MNWIQEVRVAISRSVAPPPPQMTGVLPRVSMVCENLESGGSGRLHMLPVKYTTSVVVAAPGVESRPTTRIPAKYNHSISICYDKLFCILNKS